MSGLVSKAVCLGAGFAIGFGVRHCLFPLWLGNESQQRLSVALLSGGGGKSTQDDEEDQCEAIFFPDELTSSVGKGVSRDIRGTVMYKEILYDKALQEEASLARLIKHLSAAKSSIDLCLFVINSHQLADAVLQHLPDPSRRNSSGAKSRNFRVRLIVDEGSFESAGSAVPKFRLRGAFLRFKKTSGYLMHHKFVVIDGRVVLTGSFNWTMQAIMGNKENVVVSANKKLVQSFQREFEKLWNEFET